MQTNTPQDNEFDIEWAKRGGWCYAEYTLYMRKKHTVAKYLHADFFVLYNDRNLAKNPKILGMATQSECQAAGVKYIEKPVVVDEWDWKDKYEGLWCFGYWISYTDKYRVYYNSDSYIEAIFENMEQAKAWCVNDRMERAKRLGFRI